MTEHEWLTSMNPHAMLTFLHGTGKLKERKGRLFSVGCCCRLWHHLEEPSRRAVRVIERFAEGQATEAERAAAEAEATAVSARLAAAGFGRADGQVLPESFAAAAVLCLTASTEEEARWLRYGQFIAEQVAMQACLAEWQVLGEAEVERVRLGGEDRPRSAFAHLLRDHFGNPFHPPPCIDPRWLAWNDGIVRRLAEDAYEERVMPAGTLDPQRLAVLADALLDTGCTDPEVLGHLRDPGPHCRGCWSVDLLLGKS